MTPDRDILHTGTFFTKSDLPPQPLWAIRSPKLLPVMAAGSPERCYDFQLLVNNMPDMSTCMRYIQRTYTSVPLTFTVIYKIGWYMHSCEAGSNMQITPNPPLACLSATAGMLSVDFFN